MRRQTEKGVRRRRRRSGSLKKVESGEAREGCCPRKCLEKWSQRNLFPTFIIANKSNKTVRGIERKKENSLFHYPPPPLFHQQCDQIGVFGIYNITKVTQMFGDFLGSCENHCFLSQTG